MLFYILKEKGNLKKAYKMYKASRKIKQQDLFNENFYIEKYPNVKDGKISPLHHYLYHGYKEGKRPGPLFDNNYYLNQNPDVKQSGENPLVHYVLHGKKEGRKAVKYYNAKYEKEIKRKLDRLQKKSQDHFKVLESYNRLFNDIYIYHEMTPKGLLKDVQDMCLELLIFLDNISVKYDIPYWLDYGTLLGPVRHGGYLPWDDDVDIAMLRSDFERFIEAVNKELKANNLEECIEILEKKKYDNAITGFVQIIYRGSTGHGYMLGCIDILPYDYLKNDENLPKEELKNKISDQIEITQKEFMEKEYFKINPTKAFDDLNKIIGIVDYEDEYIIPSSMNLRPNRIRIYKTEEMFPLQRIKFEDEMFLAPKEEKEYLKMSYGDEYMKMPKNIKFHTRMHALVKKEENIHEMIQNEIPRLKKVNENFK